MKKVGIIGGLSWESTSLYYRYINEGVRDVLGGLNSGRILINSLNFAEVMQIQEDGGWEELGSFLLSESQALIRAGADYIFLGANTVHKVAHIVEEGIHVPLIHIVDVVGEIIQKNGIKTCGLLGTRFTMEDDFFSAKLKREYGIETLIPDSEDRQFIHRIIYEELSLGVVSNPSRSRILQIIETLKSRGSEIAILGCTELGLLVSEKDTSNAIIDTTWAHAQKAVQLLLQ